MVAWSICFAGLFAALDGSFVEGTEVTCEPNVSASCESTAGGVLLQRVQSVGRGTVGADVDGVAPAGSVVEKHGALSVQGKRIVDKNGSPVRLRGMSLFWSQWMPQYWNRAAVEWLVSDWQITVIRCAMAIEHGGYLENPSAEKGRTEAVVDAAIAVGIYVLIDWHDHNAEQHTEQSKAFFAEMSRKYGAYPNVLFEPYNEPVRQSWSETIKPYHEELVPVIRQNTNNIIILGTRHWSQDVDEASRDRVDGENLVYTVHFYANTHRQSLRNKVTAALANGVAIFATEWGTCDASGDGSLDLVEAQAWLNFFERSNISDANWAVSDKSEACSALRPGASGTGGWSAGQLSASGLFVRASIRGEGGDYPTPGPPVPGNGCCKWGSDCGDCGLDGTGWCHESASNCAACTGTFDPSATAPQCDGSAPTPSPPSPPPNPAPAPPPSSPLPPVPPPSEGKCCLAPFGSADACGMCLSHELASPSQWCSESEAHCQTCSGSWCPSSPAPVPTPVVSPSPVPTPVVPPVPTPVVLPPADSHCCLAAKDDADKCGSCLPESWAEPSDFCASSEANCKTCSGAWCAGSGAPTPSATTQAPVPAPPSPMPQPPTPTQPIEWKRSTWTTGYWDCCKPSCSWPGKGSVNQPFASCDTGTGEVLTNFNAPSACGGGHAASCANNKPFVVRERLSMGYSAIAVSGSHGLLGDTNCGQCFELKFVDTIHSDGNWGGSHPDLVDKSMVVQVSNIGYDVNGDHSFDIQIPGAGQGLFTDGCTKQFPNHTSGDFDCDNNYGGCSNITGCQRLPEQLRSGCEWRYRWYKWLVHGGQTNNPYVDFRRVRCPEHLTNISHSTPLDDSSYPEIDLNSYGPAMTH